MKVAQEIIDLVKQALASGNKELAKSISIATGLTYYDLQAPSKNLYPTITPLRNSIPRVRRPNPGDASHWKAVTAINGSGYGNMGWVPEGQRSARMSYTTEDRSATYVTLGEEDQITFEAEAAGQGFEDLNATLTMRLLQKTMYKEEIGILGGNRSMNLGTPVTPTVSASGSGATLPTATYVVYVVALTQEGYLNSSVTAGVATAQTITGADGQTFTLNGGSGVLSAASAGQAITLGETLFASTTAIRGAVAYAWYIGTAGNEKLQQITTINSMAQSTALDSTTQAATAITGGDHSKNASYAFDGLMYTAYNASTAYYRALATGTAGTGTVLTSSGRGSVTQIDTMLLDMWNNYRVSPSVLYVNAQEQKNITDKVLNGSSSPLLRYNSDGKEYALTAGGVIEYYYNPFDINGGQKIPVKVHPNLAPGTILAWCERLPQWYQSNEVPNVAEMLTRRDYYRIDWPLRTRQREYGVYAEEVLAVYAPFAMGILTNIANG